MVKSKSMIKVIDVEIEHLTMTLASSVSHWSCDITAFVFAPTVGIPYAEPPTGSLRFQKTRPSRSWSGVKDALTAGNPCPQKHPLTGKCYIATNHRL